MEKVVAIGLQLRRRTLHITMRIHKQHQIVQVLLAKKVQQVLGHQGIEEEKGLIE